MRVQNLFTNAIQGASATVTAERRVNCYYETQQTSKGPIAVYGTPGATLFLAANPSPCRGLTAANGLIYAVFYNTLYSITTTGVIATVTTLTTNSGYVSFADNGLQLIVVDSTINARVLTYATSAVSNVTLPAAASSVAFLTGFFIINALNTGKFYISGAYDGTTWDVLQFATAESNPDNLKAVSVHHGILILWGENSIEYWVNVGASPFPFAPMVGNSLSNGLASQYGFAEVNDTVVFVSSDEQGNYTFRELKAGSPSRIISGTDINNKINKLVSITNSVAMSWSVDGHSFYQITFKSDNLTLIYDTTTGMWGERQTNMGRHLCDLSAVVNHKVLMTDYLNGNLYYNDNNAYTDNGTTITRLIQSQHLISNFNNLSMSEIYLDMETGVGLQSGQGSNPQIMMQVSKDGGRTWGNERWTTIGAVGKYITRVVWRRITMARDMVFRFKMTDPVKFVIASAAITSKGGKG